MASVLSHNKKQNDIIRIFTFSCTFMESYIPGYPLLALDNIFRGLSVCHCASCVFVVFRLCLLLLVCFHGFSVLHSLRIVVEGTIWFLQLLPSLPNWWRHSHLYEEGLWAWTLWWMRYIGRCGFGLHLSRRSIRRTWIDRGIFHRRHCIIRKQIA